MNIDNLHDALNLLDDDLIHEVDVLRSEGKQNNRRYSRKWIVRWTSLAAGLVLFVVSAYAVSALWLKGFGGAEKSDSSVMVEENMVGENIKEESAEVETDNNAMPSHQESTVNDNSSVVTGESKTEAYEVKVEITAWMQEGFIGIIKESDYTDVYTVGTELTILLNEQDSEGETSAIGVQHKDNAEDDAEYPVGSVVVVRFMKQENTEFVLYADSVTPDDAD